MTDCFIPSPPHLETQVFFNDGEKTASCVIYTPLEEDGISFYADGSARVDIEKNELLL